VSETSDPHVVEPGHAPTPFTADEIRRGCPQGRTIRLLVEAAGEQPLVRTITFKECNDAGAVQERAQATLEGDQLSPVQTPRSSWEELQAHASFPAEQTQIDPVTLQTPLGRLDCLRYTVIDGPTVQTFWFATALPGMPVRFTSAVDGQVISTVAMVSDSSWADRVNSSRDGEQISRRRYLPPDPT
jgi:hypothetical protein